MMSVPGGSPVSLGMVYLCLSYAATRLDCQAPLLSVSSLAVDRAGNGPSPEERHPAPHDSLEWRHFRAVTKSLESAVLHRKPLRRYSISIVVRLGVRDDFGNWSSARRDRHVPTRSCARSAPSHRLIDPYGLDRIDPYGSVCRQISRDQCRSRNYREAERQDYRPESINRIQEAGQQRGQRESG